MLRALSGTVPYSALRVAHDLQAALNRPVLVVDELFDEHSGELQAAMRHNRSIEWSAIGDPCVRLSCNGGRRRTRFHPAYAAEFAHAERRDRVTVVEYELWVSRLFPVFADHWYTVDYHRASRTTSHAPLPATRPPAVARHARAFLCARGYERVGRRDLCRSVGFVPVGRRDKTLRLFDLVFSSAHWRRLVCDGNGYRARLIRFGSTSPPPGDRDPGALRVAFPELDASWYEERESCGDVVARELSLRFEDGAYVAVRLDGRGRLTLATSGRSARS